MDTFKGNYDCICIFQSFWFIDLCSTIKLPIPITHSQCFTYTFNYFEFCLIVTQERNLNFFG